MPLGVGGSAGSLGPPVMPVLGSLFYFDPAGRWKPTGSGLTYDGTTLTVGSLNVTGSDINLDGTFAIENTADATKIIKFSASGITTGNTRTLTVPDSSGTLALLGFAQTWTATQAFGGITATSVTDSGLTSGRVTYGGTGGLLQDSANLTFDGTTLTANALKSTNNISIGTADPFGRGYGKIISLTSTADSGFEINSATGFTAFFDMGVNGTRYAAVTATTTLFSLNSLNSADISFLPNTNEALRLTSAGNVVLGAQSALATSATDGFPYIRTGAGTPSGVPTAYTGHVAAYYDSTNNFLYVYNGAWKKAAFV